MKRAGSCLIGLLVLVACKAPPVVGPVSNPAETNLMRFRAEAERLCETVPGQLGQSLDEGAARALYQTYAPPLDISHSLAPGELFLMRLTDINEYSRLSFSASPGVTIMNMSHGANLTGCSSIKALTASHLHFNAANELFLVIRATQAGGFVLQQVHESSLHPSPEPEFIYPPVNEADLDAMIERTYTEGVVYDQDHQPLPDVRVQLKSLNTRVPFTAETYTDPKGAFHFEKVPAGVQISFSAMKPGYAPRRRIEVMKTNYSGPYNNRYDFGTDGTNEGNFGYSSMALFDQPEVIQAQPPNRSTGVSPHTHFVLTFSEPMETDRVEDNFQVTAEGDTVSGKTVWSKSDFMASWNSDKTEVTFSFMPRRQLDAGFKAQQPPRYRVSLDAGDGRIRDASGLARDSEHFKLTDGRFTQSYTFTVAEN